MEALSNMVYAEAHALFGEVQTYNLTIAQAGMQGKEKSALDKNISTKVELTLLTWPLRSRI